MTTYTVFDNDFEEHAPHSHLTLEAAFAWVMGSCGYQHRFERRTTSYVLSVWDLDRPDMEPREELSTFADNVEARRELMLRSLDGRFKGKMALLDDEFQVRLHKALAHLDREADEASAADVQRVSGNGTWGRDVPDDVAPPGMDAPTPLGALE